MLHVLVVDPSRRAALAGNVGGRWLLPVLSCSERVRAAAAVARWCEERGMRADVAGQWLGRVTEDTTDWLVAAAASADRAAAETGLEWMSFEKLASSAAILDYQRWAVATAVDRVPQPSVSGPFGNLTWPVQVRGWIAAMAGSAPSALTPYRVGAHEVVLGADCVRGRVYFKGLVGERAAEARLTQALAAVAPESFARTLALERRDGGSVWWLTAACPGAPRRDAPLVARALAEIQQRVIETDVERLSLPAIDLESVARWASELLADAAGTAVVTGACGTVAGADIPTSWIPMDLDPTNVLVDDDGGVRFIDVDDSFVGPAPLAMAVLAQRSGDTAALRIYEESWSPPLKGLDWRSVEIAASTVQGWLGWNRLKQNVERGEVYAALDRVEVRIRERLGKAIYRR